MTHLIQLLTENAWELLGFVSAAFLLVLVKEVRNFVFKKLCSILQKAHINPFYLPSVKDVKIDKKILELLVELRTKLDSDRVTLTQFSNGTEFSAQKLGWKISVTHESCRGGIAPILTESQGIPISGNNELLQILFDRASDIHFPGMERLFCTREQCGFNSSSFHKCVRNCVFLLTVEEMAHTHLKYNLNNSNVKYAFITPVFDFFDNVVGYISVHFMNEISEATVENSREIAATAASCSGAIRNG